MDASDSGSTHPLVAQVLATLITENAGRVISSVGGGLSKFWKSSQVAIGAAFDDYTKRAFQRYAYAKTIIYKDEPQYLYSFFVPPSLTLKKKTIPCDSINPLLEAHRCIITGTGGCGKSMLMQHLMVSGLRESTRIPIFVELRDLNVSETPDLKARVAASLARFGFELGQQGIDAAAKLGSICLLLDGFDEVNYHIRESVRQQVLDLADEWPLVPIVVSSRPDAEFVGWRGFSEFGVQALTKQQAIRLIEQLQYDDDIKKRFVKDLDARIYASHTPFASNPLLVTIMLLTYGDNAEIPIKMHLFYSMVFETLWNKHDATKGGYKRRRFTTLAMDDFQRVLSLFCLQAYMMGAYSMPFDAALGYVGSTKKLSGITEFDAEEYLQDLQSSVCILVRDGAELSFSHRSFAEYYAAVAILSLPSDKRSQLLRARSWDSDSVFGMLMEMAPATIEEEYIIGWIQALQKDCEWQGVEDHAFKKRALSKYVDHVYFEENGDFNGFSPGEFDYGMWLRLVAYARNYGIYAEPVNFSDWNQRKSPVKYPMGPYAPDAIPEVSDWLFDRIFGGPHRSGGFVTLAKLLPVLEQQRAGRNSSFQQLMQSPHPLLGKL